MVFATWHKLPVWANIPVLLASSATARALVLTGLAELGRGRWSESRDVSKATKKGKPTARPAHIRSWMLPASSYS
jgi:hypothetical protein